VDGTCFASRRPMLKLERSSDGERTTIRFIGHPRSEHLGEIVNEVGSCGSRVILDLEEVTIVDVHVVRFLGTCEEQGTELLHCPLYIREWISREQQQPRPNGIQESKDD